MWNLIQPIGGNFTGLQRIEIFVYGDSAAAVDGLYLLPGVVAFQDIGNLK